MAEKPHLNLVFIGHVDHGKSTAIGRLLLETGTVPQHVIDEYKKEASAKGKATFEFAWVMDALKEERERGLTIDVAHKRFDTPKYYFTIIDCPGHRDFVKNMITGTSQADAAVLIVSAAEGEGVQAQTKEHLFLAKTLGVPQIIVGINKMDATTPPYSEKRYNAIKSELEKLLKTVGYKPEKTQFVPISAYIGDNITKPSDKIAWFKGPTFMQVLDTLTVPEKLTKLPLRLPVQDVYTITGVGTVPVGRVETGVLKPGDKIVFQPANVTGEVKTIEMHHEKIDKAEPGDNVGFNVRGVSKEEIRRGDVVGHADNPPTVAKSFIAKIIVLQHPSAIAPGYTPVFHCHTAQVACTFEELQKKLDPKTGAELPEKPEFLKAGDSAIVKIKPTRPLAIERAQDFPPLGRFAIRDMGQTVAAGLCIEIEKK
ncbi:MAG: translation elongation factor EF-1 subunit alpha [Candidatus Thermoplasmatota archaeon]|nr:translation elongation factor EF-1 subunit alpha [Candidatus Thermoplasmatota archaeon]